MDQFAKTFISDDICNEIERLEEENKDNPDAIYSLYVHIVPKEISNYNWDKYYVGITKNKPEKRWGSNGCGYFDYDNNPTHFERAIKKYGWTNLKHIVITNKLLKSDALKMEMNTIASLKSNLRQYGYNLTKGGEGGGTYHRLNIAQYDLQGNLIAVFPNITEAQKIVNVDDSVISGCITGRYLTAGQYMWKAVEDEPVKKIEPYHCPSKPNEKFVLQYDLDGNFIKEWKNLNEPSRYYNIEVRPYRTIMTGGYMWKYKTSENIDYKIPPYKKYGSKKVFVYDIDGNYIATYSNLSEAKSNLGLSSIKSEVLNRSINNNFCNGYRFTCDYYELLPPLIKERMATLPTPVVQIDNNNDIINIFKSVSAASTETGIGIKSISRCCKNIIKIGGGFKWKYLKDVDESEITDSFLLQKYHNYKSDNRKDEVR